MRHIKGLVGFCSREKSVVSYMKYMSYCISHEIFAQLWWIAVHSVWNLYFIYHDIIYFIINITTDENVRGKSGHTAAGVDLLKQRIDCTYIYLWSICIDTPLVYSIYIKKCRDSDWWIDAVLNVIRCRPNHHMHFLIRVLLFVCKGRSSSLVSFESFEISACQM